MARRRSKRGSGAKVKHYHEAKYDDDGKLLRECNACGEDLTHPNHPHARECECNSCKAERENTGLRQGTGD